MRTTSQGRCACFAWRGASACSGRRAEKSAHDVDELADAAVRERADDGVFLEGMQRGHGVGPGCACQRASVGRAAGRVPSTRCQAATACARRASSQRAARCAQAGVASRASSAWGRQLAV